MGEELKVGEEIEIRGVKYDIVNSLEDGGFIIEPAKENNNGCDGGGFEPPVDPVSSGEEKPVDGLGGNNPVGS